MAFFCATGFFPGDETYFKDVRYSYNSGSPFKSKLDAFRNFNWHYSPENRNLNTATERFAELFERTVDQLTGNNRVILPLSGGLDSRTLAAALYRIGKDVSTYSYRYEYGHDETAYGKRIADVCGFPFTPLAVRPGYLWDNIERLASLNHCYSEFTHPRQMAFVDAYPEMGEIFCLGHWGDVLFDSMGVPDDLTFDEQVKVILKKIVKKGGLSFARDLWQAWGCSGNFDEFLIEKVKAMHRLTYLDANANSSVRAFKSRYWATRWTASNFSVFESARPIAVPYFDFAMCDFICKTPENLLADRKIQINYLKRYAPGLASITWERHRPFNLNNFQWNRSPWNVPFRVLDKLRRTGRSLGGSKLIQRNWELQFEGASNKIKLNKYLAEYSAFHDLIPSSLIKKYLELFYGPNPVPFAHPVSMMLTLSLFSKQQVRQHAEKDKAVF